MTRDEARARDAADPLAGARALFDLPEGVIYLDGNSLGALPRATAARVAETVTAEWGKDLIKSWNSHDWIGAPQRVGGKIARLIGADADEVIAADSTSVNLAKLICGALSLRPGRRVILSEPGNFPTDIYIVQGLAQLGLCELRLVDRAALVAAIDSSVAAVMLTHVHYKTAEVFDMAAITAAAHAQGALAIWDLSHSAGAVPVALNAADVDLAVGCGYKYLNGGPGAPAYLYVARRHQAAIASPLTGWMGHVAPFGFDDAYAPAPGMTRFLAGTPPILALAALEVGVDMLLGLGMDALVAKGRALSDTFVTTVLAAGGDPALTLASPTDPAARGSHVSFRHPEAYAICQALIAKGIIGDFRDPDILRLGFAPAYLRFEDMVVAGETLRAILAERRWDRPEFRVRAAVT